MRGGFLAVGLITSESHPGGEVAMSEVGTRAAWRLRGAAAITLGTLLLAGAGAQAAHAAVYVVDSTADAPDVKPGDHLCVTAAATCTLRAAIQEANAVGGANTVIVPAARYRPTPLPSPAPRPPRHPHPR